GEFHMQFWFKFVINSGSLCRWRARPSLGPELFISVGHEAVTIGPPALSPLVADNPPSVSIIVATDKNSMSPQNFFTAGVWHGNFAVGPGIFKSFIDRETNGDRLFAGQHGF